MHIDMLDHKNKTVPEYKRAGRGQARLFSILLMLAALCFAAGCSKTEPLYADPSLVQTQTADTGGTDASESGGTSKETAGMYTSAGQSEREQSEQGQSEQGQSEQGQSEQGQAEEDLADEEQGQKEDITEITFTAVGDNLINEVLYEQAAHRAADAGEGKDYDFAPCYAKISPFIQEHDINWIDIETVMTDSLEPSGYPAFSTPADSGRALIDAGWNVFSLCSNHTYDQGAEGIRQTLAFWNSMKEKTGKEETGQEETGQEKTGLNDSRQTDGICFTGLWEYGTEYDIPILTCKGRKFAFLTYTYGTNDIDTPAGSPAHVIYLEEEGLMAYQIELAREQADAVIVSLHWGAEYNHEETEDQRALAQRVADMGADLIIGGHPHVAEGAEMLTAADGRKVFCAYSLGNFLCAQNSMPNPDAMIGLLLSCTFRFTDEGLEIEDHALIPILSDYGENYEDDHVVLYADYSEEEALAHGMRTMFGFTEFDYDYVRDMLTDVVGEKYLLLP